MNTSRLIPSLLQPAPVAGCFFFWATIGEVMSESFDFPQVTRVTAGAVGPPGRRTFYLQIGHRGQIVSLVLEKEQLRLLAERLQELLPKEKAATEVRSDVALTAPLAATWRIDAMTLAYDEDERRFEVSLLELVEEGQQAATGHFEATATQMQALAGQALAVVAAGRPPCPLCSGPIDHDGRVCPRLNGHYA